MKRSAILLAVAAKPRLLPALIPCALAFGLSLAAPAARAQVSGLTFTFAPAVQTVDVGGSADYTGLFSNTTLTNYFVTGGVYTPSTFGGSPLVFGFFNGDPSAANGPFEVLAGQTRTVGGVYTLSADPTLGAGTYTGAVDFQGQTEADFNSGTGTDMTLSTAPVSLTVRPQGVPAVPEASSLVSLGLLLALGGAGVWGARRRATPAA